MSRPIVFYNAARSPRPDASSSIRWCAALLGPKPQNVITPDMF